MIRRVRNALRGPALAVVATLALAACQTAVLVPPPPPIPEAAPLPPPTCPRLTWYQEGTASWYGQTHHGRPTATGVPFDMNAPTAAHRRLPLRTTIKVTNLENGKSIELLVNDRGPYIRGRVLDVSLGAARALGFEARGTAHVRIEIVEPC